ncbi:MAG: hydrogenase nickel incorporation protein HypB [Rhodospirillales bacterium]|nr:hydrogenase nickel incorporation protein HypB [Rhodospirillales bacterium]
MCTVCGCNEADGQSHSHSNDHSHVHSHDQAHSTNHSHDHDHHHFGQGAAGVSVAGYSQDRLIQIEQNILSKNDGYADGNRRWLAERGLLALNLVSSPGAGKTTLLVETLKGLKDKISLGVIEGDQETANDADRIRETGVPAIQINTGKGCHLDAHMIGHALQDLAIDPGGAIMIENVGNLVCPAAFDLGEAAKVVILSVTEGEDKPIKYPDMFAAAEMMIISKVDLLPYVDFDVDQAVAYAHRVNPDLKVMKVSAKTGEGLAEWQNWIVAQANGAASEVSAPSLQHGAPAHA